MSLREFLAAPEWDLPFFKVLAHNDTARAVGHQAGMVLPKDLRQFLPSLDEAATSSESPTTDRHLLSELFIGLTFLAAATVRYQLQTWGGTRPAESRITDGFNPLRNRAAEGDLLIFQRRMDSLNRFRLVLVNQGTPEFIEAGSWVAGRRWGLLFVDETPITQAQISQARDQIVNLSQEPFIPIRTEIPRVESRQSRIARDLVFRARVRSQYKFCCAISGIAISAPASLYEVEAAHIIPLSSGGSDDARNGIALTQSVHWAFDRGLIGIFPDRTVYVPRRIRSMTENSFLAHFHEKQIAEAATSGFRVHSAAIEWHFQNLVKQWD